MRTRSSSRLVSNPSSNPTPSTNPNPKRRNCRRSKQRIEKFNLDELSPPIVTMADQRTVAQLLQAPTEGYEDAIVVPAITADNFKLKHGLLTLVQNNPDLAGERTPRSIFTWDDLVSKFINQFFPPSKTTNLRNEITNFRQHFDESFSEAWDRFKDLLRACPHHGFSELHQLDTFYNALNSKDQDSLNSTAGGNFLDKMPCQCLAIIESKSKVCYSRNKPVVPKVSTNTSNSGISPDVAELKDMVKALLLDKNSQNQSPAPVKAVEESCVTCGGAHSYRNCPATDGNVYRDNIQEFVSQAFAVNYNQGNTSYRPPMMSNQIRPPGPVYQPLVFQPPAYQAPAYQASAYQAHAPQTQGVSKEDFLAYIKDNDAVMRNIASTLSSGTLPSNTIAHPRSDLNVITTRSSVSCDGPQIPPPPSFFPKVVEDEPEATKDTMNPTNNESTKDVQPQVVQSESPVLISEPVTSPISEPVIAPLSEMARTSLNEHCSVVLLKKLPKNLGDPGKFLIPCDFPELADRLISRLIGVAEDVYVKVGSFHFPADFVVVDFDADPRVPSILRRSFLKTGRALIDVFEEYWQEVLGFSDVISSGNPTLYYDLIVSTTSPTLTLFGNSDFLLEKVDAFLAIEDDPTSLEFYQPYLDPDEDILLLKAFLNDDPSLPSPNQGNYLPEVHKELKICEAKYEKSLVDEPLEVELKDLPPHLKYEFLEGNDKLPVIIAKDLSVEEKTALITDLKSHKQAITWKLSDIKGIDPELYTHKILIEEDFERAVQYQRRVNPKIHDVIKQEVIKLLEAGLIYPISDSPWVSPVHCKPKKEGFTVVENEDNELILTRLVTGWRVCIDFRKLNEATSKDHFPLSFMDQMLERLAGKSVLLFSRRFFWLFPNSHRSERSEENHIHLPIRNVFLSPHAFWATQCSRHVSKEKSHFMVKEGIVFGHKISKQGIEVDKAKVDVITKLPHPTTVKVIRSFLGHAGFYRRFIKDFSKIARTMTRILEKDTPFIFSQEYVDAFQTLKRKLTEAHILIAPDWDMPFELMCDASDFTIGEVLGKRQDKHFRPIHYASKTITEAESNYTTTKKEMLAMVYAFEKFRSYLIMNQSIVYTDHSALKYLFAKKDSKVYPYGTVELSQPDGPNFKVNSHRLSTILERTYQSCIPENLKTRAGFCPPVFISSASLGYFVSKSNRANVYLLAYLINGLRFT
nr:reverse transcriptase domain-containing protein [Tanacetum cinerariifolium]